MIRFKHLLLKGLIFFIILLLGGILLVRRYQKAMPQAQNNRLNQPQELISQPQETEVHSLDGTMTLVMRTELQYGYSQTYSFWVVDISGKERNERLIFTKTIEPEEEISIPYNSWSPGNKYVFLRERDKNDQINFLVLKTSGESFSNGEQYLDMEALFNQKKTDYFLNNVTGWASAVFLNLTTNKDSGEKGPSYWLDVTSRAFWGHQ